MKESIIWEEFELPSKGIIYDKKINPKGKIRSMTTQEELMRLNPSDTIHKTMCDVIESCLESKFDGMHVTDLCIADYQYLAHKLRMCTYGTNYKMLITCPHCGKLSEVSANLKSLEIRQWDESKMREKMLITLPVSNHTIELRFQTPRDLDVINYKAKEKKKREKTSLDYTLMFSVATVIAKVDGTVYDKEAIEDFVLKLPMRDIREIMMKAKEVLEGIGLASTINVTCSQCGDELNIPFRIYTEYWEPTY